MYVSNSTVFNNPALLKKLGLSKADILVTDEAIETAFLGSVHADSVGAIYTRAYTDLVGITSAMDAEISRILATGLLVGDNPKIIAKPSNTHGNTSPNVIGALKGGFIGLMAFAVSISMVFTLRS